MKLRILLAEAKSLMAELDKFRPLSAEIKKKRYRNNYHTSAFISYHLRYLREKTTKICQ